VKATRRGKRKVVSYDLRVIEGWAARYISHLCMGRRVDVAGFNGTFLVKAFKNKQLADLPGPERCYKET
jgi:hypothetical protein